MYVKLYVMCRENALGYYLIQVAYSANFGADTL